MNSLKTFFLLLILGLLLTATSFAQAPGIDWQKILGWTADDKGIAVTQTSDGNYVVAGVVGGGYPQAGCTTNGTLVIKVSSVDGSTKWQLCLEDTDPYAWDGDHSGELKQTSDGGFILVAHSHSRQYKVVKFTAEVNAITPPLVQWSKSYGSYNYNAGSASRSIIEVKDVNGNADGYLIAGSTDGQGGDITCTQYGLRDIWLVRLNSDGTIRWNTCIGGSQDDIAYSVQQTFNPITHLPTGYVVAGTTATLDGSGNMSTSTPPPGKFMNGGTHIIVIKLGLEPDPNTPPTPDWINIYGGNGNETVNKIIETSDGGYLFVGKTKSFTGDVTGLNIMSNQIVPESSLQATQDYYIYSLGANPGFASNGASSNTVGLLFTAWGPGTGTGTAVSYWTGITYDMWLVKLNPSGGITWRDTIGYNYGDDAAIDVQQTEPDKGYIVLGESLKYYSNMWGTDLRIIKFATETGTSTPPAIEWDTLIGGGGQDHAGAIQQTIPDMGYIVTGAWDSYYGGGGIAYDDIWIVKLFNSSAGVSDVNSGQSNIFIGPSPTNDVVNISFANEIHATIKVYNSDGSLVYDSGEGNFTGSHTIRMGKFASGVYIIRITDGEKLLKVDKIVVKK